MQIPTLTALLVCSIIASLIAESGNCVTAFDRADFYVSPRGDDSWSGKLPQPNEMRTDGPFASIARAQKAVRNLLAVSKPSRPIVVLIREGVYRLTEPIVFLPEDSGTKTCPVIYAAYPGEKPVLSGGRKISGWKQADSGLWIVEIPDVRDGKWYFSDLYVNNQRRFRPRLPKESFYFLADVVKPDVRDAFVYADEDIKPWQNLEDVELVAFNAWDELRFRIKSIDVERRVVTFTGSNNWEWKRWEGNNRYYVENVKEALDEPGEWYLDRKTGVLTYYPFPGEKPDKVEVIAPVLNELVRFEGDAANGKPISYVYLRGLTFQHTGWTLPRESYISVQAAFKIPGILVMNDCVSCGIENCEFSKIGQYGIELRRGCKNCLIKGNKIYDMGAGGVKVGEPIIRDDEKLRTENNKIIWNYIYDGGKTYPSAVGIWIGQSGGNVVSHNHIHDLYYTGISLGWTWGYGPSLNRGNVVEYNHIHELGKGLLSDMGGIYTLGAREGTVLRYNLIHDVTSHSYGGWGIYFDEGSSNVLAEYNVCYNCKTGGFHQHYGKENVVRNNIFAYAKVGQLQRTRPEEHISFTFERNIVYWTEGPLLHGNWSDDKFRMDYNLYWNASGQKVDFFGLTFDQWKSKGMDVHSLIVDPLFENPEKRDFRLKENSPAFSLGFKRFNLEGVPGI